MKTITFLKHHILFYRLYNVGLVCLLLSISNKLTAQEQDSSFVFSEINAASGLSGNQVRSIEQLSDGRIVVVTEGLIDLYNGTSFKYLHYDEDKDYELSNYSGYNRLYIGPEDGIWLKNNHTLKYINMQDEKFVKNLSQIFQNMGVKERVTDFFIDPYKNFWLLTENNNLFFKDKFKKKASLFLESLPLDDPLFDITVTNNHLYLFFQSGAVAGYEFQTKKKTEYPAPEGGVQLYNKTLLIVSDGDYIYQVRNGVDAGIVHRLNLKTGNYELVYNPNYTLNMLLIDEQGNVWITSPNGIVEINFHLEHQKDIKKLKLVNGDLINSEISTIFFDRDNGLWVGTLNRGLLYYHQDRFKFKNIGRSLFPVDGEPDLDINGFAEVGGKILVASDAGLFTFEFDSQILQRILGLPINASCNFILANSSGKWVGTSDGLFKMTSTGFEKLELAFKEVHGFKKKTDSLYLLATDEGVFSFNTKDNSVKAIETKMGSVYDITFLDNQSFAGISEKGLFIKEGASGNLLTSKDQSDLYFFHQTNQNINDLFTDTRGWVWMATKDGLSVWNPKTHTLNHFYAKDGLVNNSIQAVIEDSKQQIWASTSNGLSCIQITEENQDPNFTFTNYNQYDGVVDYEFVKRSVYRSNSGSLFWGGLDGFNIFNPTINKLRGRKLSKPVFVNFQLFGNSVEPHTRYNQHIILSKSIEFTKEISLDYDQNFISILFSGLNFTNVSQTKYAYKLEGLEDTCQTSTTENGLGKATYTDLDPGKYVFNVKSSLNGSLWSEIKQLNIMISPPWWKTWYAYVTYILLFTFIVYILFVMIFRFQKQKLEIKHENELRILKDQFFTNISHELRTPLTLILTPLEALLKSEKGSLKLKITNIHQSAVELLKLVNQLLDFKKIETNNQLSLTPTWCNLKALLISTSQPFNELAKLNKKNFECKFPKEEAMVLIDTEKFKMIVNNLLSNAFKFTQPHDKIVFSAKLKENAILNIEVKDTGFGIPKEEQINIFKRYYRFAPESENTGSGIGLHLVKTYLELLGGSIFLNSELKKGSTFTINIPVETKVTSTINEEVDSKEDEDKYSVLIVEDHSDFREFLAFELSSDYKVYTAPNGQEGLSLIKAHYPDLVVSDIMMPILSGIQLCHQVKSDIQISHIPVILLTARSSDESKIQGFEAKADAYISKPFNLEILKLRIRNLIEDQKRRNELFKNSPIIHPEEITTSVTDQKFLENVLELVHQNLGNVEYSVYQLSNDMFMDRTGLYRKLKAISGTSPNVFIRTVRLKKAKQLLINGKSVSEVCELVGFSSPSYFSKCFQEEFNEKPSAVKN